ncbi:hypothetical protein HDU98_009399 [Podochytrium sp. JEL0797]|nr:hypothetical protein HDU98_009399 [Podochytrium sp. JEL0797]
MADFDANPHSLHHHGQKRRQDDQDDANSPGFNGEAAGEQLDPANNPKAKKTGRPGRKRIEHVDPNNKRLSQNRAAQRAYRERQINHVKELEIKVGELNVLLAAKYDKEGPPPPPSEFEKLEAESAMLKNKVASLEEKLLEECPRTRLGASAAIADEVVSTGDFNNCPPPTEGNGDGEGNFDDGIDPDEMDGDPNLCNDSETDEEGGVGRERSGGARQRPTNRYIGPASMYVSRVTNELRKADKLGHGTSPMWKAIRERRNYTRTHTEKCLKYLNTVKTIVQG